MATVFAGNAVFGMRPSFSHLRHARSNSDCGGIGAPATTNAPGAPGRSAPGAAVCPAGAPDGPAAGAVGDGAGAGTCDAGPVPAAGAGGACVDRPDRPPQNSRTMP